MTCVGSGGRGGCGRRRAKGVGGVVGGEGNRQTQGKERGSGRVCGARGAARDARVPAACDARVPGGRTCVSACRPTLMASRCSGPRAPPPCRGDQVRVTTVAAQERPPSARTPRAYPPPSLATHGPISSAPPRGAAPSGAAERTRVPRTKRSLAAAAPTRRRHLQAPQAALVGERVAAFDSEARAVAGRGREPGLEAVEVVEHVLRSLPHLRPTPARLAAGPAGRGGGVRTAPGGCRPGWSRRGGSCDTPSPARRRCWAHGRVSTSVPVRPVIDLPARGPLRLVMLVNSDAVLRRDPRRYELEAVELRRGLESCMPVRWIGVQQ